MNANFPGPKVALSMMLVFCGVPLAAQAAVLVSGTATDNGNGTFTYAYTVNNTSGAFAVMGWSLDLNFGPGSRDWDPDDVGFGGDVVVPANWMALSGIPVIGSTAQDFLSFASATDVAIGATVGGFSFVSALPPGTVPVYAFGLGGESDKNGTTTGPMIIPEPTGAAVLVVLLGGAYGVWRRSRGETA